MATLTNTKIKDTYKSLLKVSDNGNLEAGLQEITDGEGNLSGVQLNTGGDLTASGTVAFGSLKDSGENITIAKFVDEADGIAANDNDTSIPTSAAVKDYVDTKVTAEDLDFAGDSGTGAVDLDSQTFTISGTANEIETSASGQTITIGLPSSVTVGTLNATTLGGTLSTAAQPNITSVGTLSSLAVSGNLTVDTNTLYVDAASNEVGIGTTSVDSKLHIESAFTPSASAQQLKIENTTTGQPSVLGMFAVADNGGAGNAGAIYFDAGADGSSSNNILAFNADHQSDNNYDLVLTGQGRVGIGTSSPNSQLTVLKNQTSDTAIEVCNNGTASATTTSSFILSENQGSYKGWFRRYRDGSARTSIGFVNTFTFEGEIDSTPTERMRITSAGNVGIGTSSPAQKLDVNGAIAINGTRTFSTIGSVSYIWNNTDSLYVVDDTGNNVQLAIKDSGNVGIGTNSPSQKLDVNGNIEFLGRIAPSANTATAASPSICAGFDYDTGIFNPADNTMAFSTTGSERMRIDNSGNVGIGTTNADIFGRFYTRSVGIDSAGTTKIQIDGATYSGIDFGVNGVRSADITNASSGYAFATLDARPMTFLTNAVERMRIDFNGRVGIGTNSPTDPLHLVGSTASLKIESTNANGSGSIAFHDSAGLNGSIGYLSSTTDDLFIYNAANRSTIFSTNATERMRIDNSGRISVGFSSWSSFGAVNLGVGQEAEGRVTIARGSNGQVARFYNSTGFAGDITLTGSSTAYNTSSDYRLKENVVEMTGALDRLDALKPSRFNFIADPEKTVDGFLAHEVQAIVPEAVTGEKDAVDEEGNPIYQGIDQSKLVPLLVGAIKELRAEIELLKAK